MTRRALLLAMGFAPLCTADPASQVWDLFTSIASALSSNDAGTFLAAFDRKMPDYAALRTDVEALLRENLVQSAVESLRNEGDSQRREVDLDWRLHLTAQNPAAKVTRRHETVRCLVEKRGRRWRIVKLEPASFFAPPGTGKSSR